MEEIKHPSHYNGSCAFECWDLMEMIFRPEGLYTWCIINAFKYCYRCKAKHPDNPVEDLLKAKQCLDKALEVADNKGLQYGDMPTNISSNARFLQCWIENELQKYSMVGEPDEPEKS